MIVNLVNLSPELCRVRKKQEKGTAKVDCLYVSFYLQQFFLGGAKDGVVIVNHAEAQKESAQTLTQSLL